VVACASRYSGFSRVPTPDMEKFISSAGAAAHGGVLVSPTSRRTTAVKKSALALPRACTQCSKRCRSSQGWMFCAGTSCGRNLWAGRSDCACRARKARCLRHRSPHQSGRHCLVRCELSPGLTPFLQLPSYQQGDVLTSCSGESVIPRTLRTARTSNCVFCRCV
jgi:hypothetical protein